MAQTLIICTPKDTTTRSILEDSKTRTEAGTESLHNETLGPLLLVSFLNSHLSHDQAFTCSF